MNAQWVMDRMVTLEQQLLKAKDEIASLRKARQIIVNEISANGCEGDFEECCVDTEHPAEDWCRWCRMGNALSAGTRP